MSRKAFFSTVIIIFALFFLMFFITLRSNNITIKFDESPRLLALKSEEAYAFLDKNLTYNYIDFINISSDCNVTKDKVNDFNNNYLYGLYDDAQINSFCKATITDFKEDNFVPNDHFDVNIFMDLNCTFANKYLNYKIYKDLNYTIYKDQTVVFHKRYKSWGPQSDCKFILTDLDADMNYIDTTT